MDEVKHINQLAEIAKLNISPQYDISDKVMQQISLLTTSSSRVELTWLVSGCAIAAVVTLLVGLNIVEKIANNYSWAVEANLSFLS